MSAPHNPTGWIEYEKDEYRQNARNLKVAEKIVLLWCVLLKGKLSNIIIFKSLFEQKMDSNWIAPNQE